mgnify:FL=1
MINFQSRTVHLVCFAAEYRGIEDAAIPPAGILYVGDALKKAGFEVTVHHISSSSIRDCVKAIVKTDPLFVGFSVITGSPVVHSARMSRLLKQHAPDLPVVWGGIHPSLLPESCLGEESVDYVVKGEGEVTVQELACALHSGGSVEAIRGLCWKDAGGQIHLNEDRPFMRNIDDFKQDWSLLNPLRYVRTGFDGRKYFSFITSRGCPHNCGFCYNLAFNRRRWRAHSVEFVIRQLSDIRRLTGIDCVAFNDDNFLANEERAFEILARLKNIGIEVSWLEVRLDGINDRVLGRLSQLGVRTLFIGWESGSNRTLKAIDKGFDTGLILRAFSLAAKYGFHIDASAIVGFPFETEADWQATIDMALQIDALNPGKNKFNIGVYVPYPGTPIAKMAIEKGFRFPENIMEYGAFDILKGEMRLPWITPSQVKRFSRVDRYAKLMYTGAGFNPLITLARRALAGIARLRLKSNLIGCPVEASIYDALVKAYLTARVSSSIQG